MTLWFVLALMTAAAVFIVLWPLARSENSFRSGNDLAVYRDQLDEIERDRANFISNIIIDSLSPTNTLAGNPTAQKRLIDSGGLSLVKGLKNAYDDMVHNKGMVSQVNKKPFKLGENVATSKGAVVLRTEMMELIHYAPTTDEVYAIPQLTIPPPAASCSAEP